MCSIDCDMIIRLLIFTLHAGYVMTFFRKTFFSFDSSFIYLHTNFSFFDGRDESLIMGNNGSTC